MVDRLATRPGTDRTPTVPVAERRVTSILFADLAGFTPFAEQLDPEEVRDMLSGYFDRCRETIASYGGTVEKFIGDAVMAVWGVPTTHEDDAARAVRAGLDLVDRVARYGQLIGAADLQVRVGIATGEVAVTVGAVGQGMVSGDAVNTASRVQARATPGQVWVDDQTASLTSDRIVYADQGEHQLKGKAHPLHLYEVDSILSNHGDGPHIDQLSVPLAGYGRELAQLKETFHLTVDEGRGRLLLVVGEPGVGKTRLAQELRTYLDGLTTSIYWHWGECLTYGEGIVYAALVHAVHHKLGTTGSDPASVVSERIATVLAEVGATETEQAWLGPRLGVLLGVSGGAFTREDLFAAWLAWFELLGRDGWPLVWVVEDAHHADDGLLDFMEHLARTATTPVLVLALSRPELLDRRPRFGAGRRMTQLSLDGINDDAMGHLLDALVEDLPPDQRKVLVQRADGIPLYAIETVRSMLDSGVVRTAEPGQRTMVGQPVGPAPVVPASLQVLVSSRLDALPAGDRLVLQDAAVLGTVFDRDDLVVLSGMEVAEVDASLGRLIQRDLVRVITDRFSPHTGRYAFVQSVVRQVAYEVLSRRDRIERHVQIANEMMDDAVSSDRAAIVAQHLTDAIALTAEHDPLRVALADQRAQWLERAGDRARSVGATGDAFRLYDLALEQVDDPVVRNRLLILAGQMANASGLFEMAIDRARAVLTDNRTTRAMAVTVESRALRNLGRSEDYPAALREFSTPESLADVPLGVAVELASLWVGAIYEGIVGGDGLLWAEWSYRWARMSGDPELIANALNAFFLVYGTRPGMDTLAKLFVDESTRIARDNHLVGPLFRSLINQSSVVVGWDLDLVINNHREVINLAIQAGTPDWVYVTECNLCNALWLAGEWDECLQVERARVQPEGDHGHIAYAMVQVPVVMIERARGVASVPADWADLDVIDVASRLFAYTQFLILGVRHWVTGNLDMAQTTLMQATAQFYDMQHLSDDFLYYWTITMDMLTEAGNWVMARDQLAIIEREPSPMINPYLQASLRAWRGTINALDPESTSTATIEEDLRAGIEGLAAFGAVPYRARAQATLGQWLITHGRVDEGREHVLAAAATYRDLGAIRWLSDLPEEFRKLSAS